MERKARGQRPASKKETTPTGPPMFDGRSAPCSILPKITGAGVSVFQTIGSAKKRVQDGKNTAEIIRRRDSQIEKIGGKQWLC